MKILSLPLLFFAFFSFGQSSETIRLENERARILGVISIYQDSISDIDHKLASLRRREYEESVINGSLVVYSYSDAPLRNKPDIFGDLIVALPSNTELRVEGLEGIYYRVHCSFGRGFVSKQLVRTTLNEIKYEKGYKAGYDSETPTEAVSGSNSKSKSSSTYTPRKSYSSSRTYYTGPRGGCYYINSNGNKSYVDRSKC